MAQNFRLSVEESTGSISWWVKLIEACLYSSLRRHIMADYKKLQTDLFAVAETDRETEINGFKIISNIYIIKVKIEIAFIYIVRYHNRQLHNKIRLCFAATLVEPKAATVRKYVWVVTQFEVNSFSLSPIYSQANFTVRDKNHSFFHTDAYADFWIVVRLNSCSLPYLFWQITGLKHVGELSVLEELIIFCEDDKWPMSFSQSEHTKCVVVSNL